MATPPPPPPSWVILGTVARVPAEDGAGGLSLALAAPPRVSLLTVPRHVFPDGPTPRNFPTVVAADPSGLLLIHADQGRATGPAATDRPGHHSLGLRQSVAGYFVLDICSDSEFRLPVPEHVADPGNLGLLLCPGGYYVVAELWLITGSDKATLLCYPSDVGEWVYKRIHCPLQPRPWTKSPNGVVSHSGRLWWVDLSWGVLTCDPFPDVPVLRFVPLPQGKVLEYREAWGELDKYRCVGVSAGKLRFVDMCNNPHLGGATKLSIWTLADPDSTEWTLEHEASFAEIWDDESYKATGLPKRVPVLALIHRKNPDLVYFFLKEHLFAVDVRARKVVQCEVYELVAPRSKYVSSSFVCSWELPQPQPQPESPHSTSGSCH